MTPGMLRAFSSRSVTSAASSATRRPAVAGSEPTSAMQASPLRGAQCGSQRTQFQCRPASGSADSTTIWRSRGLCRAAAWPTSQRASPRELSSGPARPSTPSSGSGSGTGTFLAVGGGGSSASAGRALLGHDLDRDRGRLVSPTRRCRVSGSCARRSHSRRRGPVAVSSTWAGSGEVIRRSASSAACAAAMVGSSSASFCLYSRMARWCDTRPCRRSVIHWPTIMTGLMIMNSAYIAECRASTIASPRTSGRSAASSWRRAFSPRLGSAGTSMRRGRLAGHSRGGRL